MRGAAAQQSLILLLVGSSINGMENSSTPLPAGLHPSDLPTDRDELWAYADAWISQHGDTMDTWQREDAWTAIVAAVNPAWVVGLTQRRRLQRRTTTQRLLAERRAQRHDTTTWPNPLPTRPQPGDQIRYPVLGHLSEPFTVTDLRPHRRPPVLHGPSGPFEHCWDPYSTYPA